MDGYLIPSHADLRPRISIGVWPIMGSRSPKSLALILMFHRLGAKQWALAWEGINTSLLNNRLRALAKE